jgi:hypothetical protein
VNETPDQDVDDRPWEKPGRFRLDCEPHRAGLLLLLGDISFWLAIVSLCTCLPGVVSLPLGATVWVNARRDLERMHAGTMDPRGRDRTALARSGGGLGVVLTLLAWAVWGLSMLAMYQGGRL